MASTIHPQAPATSAQAQDVPLQTQPAAIASTPVEMNSYPGESSTSGPITQIETSKSIQNMPAGPTRTDTTTALAQAAYVEDVPPPLPSFPPAVAGRDRAHSSAIGPSTDSPSIPTKEVDSVGPSLLITLLLTNGARHPYRLDSSYLKRRNTTVTNDDPYNLSVYKLKELILRDWRPEWEQQPSSPSAIRLISFGKLLEDKQALKELRFSHDAANVVHMTIKPQDFIEEEDAKGAKGAKSQSGDGEGRSPGCRCIVM